MRDNNNFNGPGTGLDQRLGINERPIDLLSYNAGLYRAMNKKAGSDAQEENNPQPGPSDDKNWFYVEDVSGLGNTLIIRLDFEADPSEITASYDFYVSKDKESWTKLDTLDSTSKTVMYEFGECEKVYLRCSANFFYDDDFECGVRINCINSYNIGGNIMSLLYGSDFTGNEKVLPECSEYESAFGYLFNESETLISAKNLILPATTLSDGCYDEMFGGCTSLTKTPQLPATTLANYCYEYMFASCTSLTAAPELPATTLAESCYNGMFESCSALTTAPQLPATTLTPYCYADMFANCTSLTNAPELPATTLAEGCYQGMFESCSALTTAPQLPATTLANYCYDCMFASCTSLTAAPELPATTLAPGCYGEMFESCSALNTVITHANDISANSCLDGWLNNVANSGTFYNLGSAEYTTGDSGIPEGWTVETELPQE